MFTVLRWHRQHGQTKVADFKYISEYAYRATCLLRGRSIGSHSGCKPLIEAYHGLANRVCNHLRLAHCQRTMLLLSGIRKIVGGVS
jgi:hypothetical protein